MTWSWSRGTSPAPTGVGCPACRNGQLVSRFSCLQTHFSCGECGRRFLLAELVDELGEEDFERLAAAVDGRHSDRVW